MFKLHKARLQKKRERIYKLDQSKLLTKEDLQEIKHQEDLQREIDKKRRLWNSLSPQTKLRILKRVAEKGVKK